MNTEPARRWPSRGTLVRIGIGVLLLATVFFFGQRFLSIRASLAALTAFEPAWLVPIFACSAAYFVLKGVRWHYYLAQAGVRVPIQRTVAAYLAGQWFTFTPGGEFMRAYLLAGKDKFPVVAPTIVAQAWIDIVSLAVMATLAVPIFPRLAPAVLPITLPLLVAVVITAMPPAWRYVGTLSPVRWLRRRYGKSGWGEAASQVVHSLRFRPVVFGLAISIPILFLGTAALYFSAHSIGLVQVNLSQAVAVYSMLLLLGGISPMPQGLGVAESSGTFYFAYLGVDISQALVAVLVFRAATLGLSAVIGLIAFLFLRWAVPDLGSVSVHRAGRPVFPVRPAKHLPAQADTAEAA
jgi:glycosyltransferase 2 family protein